MEEEALALPLLFFLERLRPSRPLSCSSSSFFARSAARLTTMVAKICSCAMDCPQAVKKLLHKRGRGDQSPGPDTQRRRLVRPFAVRVTTPISR